MTITMIPSIYAKYVFKLSTRPCFATILAKISFAPNALKNGIKVALFAKVKNHLDLRPLLKDNH
jgi:hypothetical protein